jgi:hypothetical protein
MNEVYYEETAFPYDYKKQKALLVICRVFITIFMITGIFFALMTINFIPLGIEGFLFPLIVTIWCVLTLVLMYYVKAKLYNCYDYIFVTGDVRIIKVVNTKKRKKLVVFDSKDVFQVGRFESETYEKHKNAPGVKVVFAPTNKYVADKPKYYIGATVDGVKHLIVLECTEKFLYYVLQFSGKHLLEKEF